MGISLDENYIFLSKKLEDQLKAVEWACEQKKKIFDDKSGHIADTPIEKKMPLVLKNGVQKWRGYTRNTTM